MYELEGWLIFLNDVAEFTCSILLEMSRMCILQKENAL